MTPIKNPKPADIRRVRVKSCQPSKYIHTAPMQPVMRTGHKSTNARASLKVMIPTFPFTRASNKCLHCLSQRKTARIARAIRNTKTVPSDASIILIVKPDYQRIISSFLDSSDSNLSCLHRILRDGAVNLIDSLSRILSRRACIRLGEMFVNNSWFESWWKPLFCNFG